MKGQMDVALCDGATYLFDAFHRGGPFVHLLFCLFVCRFAIEAFLGSLREGRG